MNREERERMVERLLNEALAPQEVEPRAGLEQRILANLRAQPERPWWWRWMWVPAVAAAVIALVVGLRMSGKPQPARPTIAIEHQAAPTAPLEKSASPVPLVAEQRKPAPGVTHRDKVVAAAPTIASLPRQAVFPSPVPMTPEETMLLTLLRRNPLEAVLVAREQAMDWERILRNFQTGEAVAPSSAGQDMR
jgi:hypothetical protein